MRILLFQEYWYCEFSLGGGRNLILRLKIQTDFGQTEIVTKKIGTIVKKKQFLPKMTSNCATS
jgi:hypothetical protein